MKERKRNSIGEYCCVIIFYDFKTGLEDEKWFERLYLAYEDEVLSYASKFRWFKKILKYRSFLLDAQHTEKKPFSALILEIVSSIRKTSIDDIHCLTKLHKRNLALDPQLYVKLLIENYA